jgi:phosphonate transport system substrate-binding protein
MPLSREAYEGKTERGLMVLIMLRRLITGMILFSVLFCLLAGESNADAARKHFIMGILPCSDVELSFKKFHLLIAYLKKQTGLELVTVLPKDFEEFEWAIKNGEIDFAFQDPHTYVRLARLYHRDALIRALTTNGETYQYGLIVTMKGSGINKMDDLRGKTVMFGPKFSSTKWIAAKEAFKDNGILIDKDLRAYFNGGCCEDIAFNVYLKSVDAGVVCDHFLDEHSDKQKELGINIKQFNVIGKTGPVPTKVFAARKELDSSLVIKMNQALLDLDKNNPAHAQILYPAEFGGFQKSEDKDYDTIRILVGDK